MFIQIRTNYVFFICGRQCIGYKKTKIIERERALTLAHKPAEAKHNFALKITDDNMYFSVVSSK